MALIGNLVNSVDPSMIVLGGGVILNNAEFRKLLIRHTRKFIFCDDVKSIKILLSKLKVDTELLVLQLYLDKFLFILIV